MAEGVKRDFAENSPLQLWVAQLPDTPCPAGAEALLAQLPKALTGRVTRFQHANDRLLRLGGIQLLAHALHSLAGTEPAQSYKALYYDACGRPCIASATLHSPWQVSFSYAFPWVACAMRCGPASDGIGIDMELTDLASPLYAGPTAHFTHTFNPDEQEVIASAADSGSSRVQRWTIKEAVLKAVGTGLRPSPLCINTCVQPAAHAAVTIRTGIQRASNTSPQSPTQEPVYTLQHDQQRIFYQTIPFSHGWLSIAAITPWQKVKISFLRLVQKGHTLLLL